MALQLTSTVKKEGVLELAIADVEIPEPADDGVVIRVEAAPINPSDLGPLFASADMSTARVAGTGQSAVVTADIPESVMPAMAARIDRPLRVGNEGAGVVVAAGSSAAAQALMGKTVATWGGSMYAQYRAAGVDQCLVLPEGTTPAEGASCFVNPLTVLGMIGTMRLEGHTGIVHTAAASNLGQMLVKACKAEGVPLVNIVRKAEHVALLENLGAEHVVNSSAPTFMQDLVEAVGATDATLGFDATGGGHLASRILTAMEVAQSKKSGAVGGYGSVRHKQVYIYGGLDRSPTELTRSFGMAWGLGGWLLPNYLERVGPEEAQKMREKVAAEIKTTFASGYTQVVSLQQALTLDAIRTYGKQATGEKYLINPKKEVD